MKTLHKNFFITVAAMFLTTQAKAVLYWGRPYDPNLQRWIQRDPIAEQGGINLHQFVGNDPIDYIDSIGLKITLILLDPSDEAGRNAIKYPNDNSIYSIIGHGNQQNVADDRGKSRRLLTPLDLANIIRADPQYKQNEPVKLVACNTGTGSNSFAQQLANALGTTVFAPDGGYAGLNDNMSVVVGATDKNGNLDENRPTWGLSIFYPQKSK